MEVVSYNIQFGRGLDRQIDLNRICQSINGADIICLQEVDVNWQRSGGFDQAKVISKILPEYFTVFGSSFDVDNSFRKEDGRVVNRRRKHGDMILSRWPILSSRTFNLTKTHHADKFNMQMGFVDSVIEVKNKTLRVYNCHAGYLEAEERLAQIRQLVKTYHQTPCEHGAWGGKAKINGDDWSDHKEAPRMPNTAIVCGDFNCAPGSHEYQYLISNSDLNDCGMLSDPDNSNTTTLRHGLTEDIKISGKVDHILVSNDLVDRIQRVAIDHDADGSDHKPIRCILDI